MAESLGIILAGGSATRLRPVTTVTSKQLLPVYDKPVIFYPLTTLILSGFRDIALISTPRALPLYRELLGDGSTLGINLYFIEQPEPNGLAAAFLLTEHINTGKNSALILGDNLFHGGQFGKNLSKFQQINGAQIFAYAVENPEEFGIVTFDSHGIVKTIEEKPRNSRSNWAVPGFYFYDQTVVERAKFLNPSKRGELEITDLNNSYLNDSALVVEKIPRGTAWLDLGTPDGLLDASEYVRTLQKRQGMPIGSPEEAAWRMGNINNEEFLDLIKTHPNPHYKTLLQKAVEFK